MERVRRTLKSAIKTKSQDTGTIVENKIEFPSNHENTKDFTVNKGASESCTCLIREFVVRPSCVIEVSIKCGQGLV